MSHAPADGATPAAAPRSAAERWQRTRDSVAAEQIALEHGPRVTVRASYTTFGSQRRVRASFSARDDAYVLVGHVDANGQLEVLFPRTPRDDGFIEGGRSYQIPEFDAGFATEYAFARQVAAYRYRPLSSRFSSYDGGTGYVFVIAGWKPMRFDRIVDDSAWSSYELVDAYATRDPREAVDELAALIANDGPEAYTVDYAKYFRSNAYGSYANGFGYGDAYCSDAFGYSTGFGGFGYSPYSSYGSLAGLASITMMQLQFGLGGGWMYMPIDDPFTGCRSYRLVYTGSPFTYGAYGYKPALPGDTAHADHPWGKHPRWPVRGGTTGGAGGVTLASSALAPRPPHLDPRYRDRGLLTTGDAETPGRIRRPDLGGAAPQLPNTRFDQPRPGLTDMVLGHREGDVSRSPRGTDGGRARGSEPGPRSTGRAWGGSSGARQGGGSTTTQRPSSSGSPRVERPHESPRSAEPSHAQPAQSHPAPVAEPRVERKPPT